MYALGTQVRITATFTADGTNKDPTTVTLYVQRPRTALSTITSVTRDSQGVYHYDVVLDRSGEWLYRWAGTGAVVAGSFDTPINVAPSALT